MIQEAPWVCQTKSNFLLTENAWGRMILRSAHTEDAGIIQDSACRQGALGGSGKWDGEQRISVASPRNPQVPAQTSKVCGTCPITLSLCDRHMCNCRATKGLVWGSKVCFHNVIPVQDLAFSLPPSFPSALHEIYSPQTREVQLCAITPLNSEQLLGLAANPHLHEPCHSHL